MSMHVAPNKVELATQKGTQYVTGTIAIVQVGDEGVSVNIVGGTNPGTYGMKSNAIKGNIEAAFFAMERKSNVWGMTGSDPQQLITLAVYEK